MKRYFAYIRVSTEKQGEHGVSLQEQKEILQRYAVNKGLVITRWFEEKETASKIGRPVFNLMLRLLKQGAANGVVIHKVDRGARNYRDWAEIGELVHAGIEVHFATESLDLTTLGGMLSADLQAVMSVHYSRNLREEVKKGYYGRLKQGLCPRPAPLGYVNNGKGRPKTIDPVQGPIVKKAFELYATGRFSLLTLREELYRLGLRTRQTPNQAGGKKVSRNTLADILSNPFYKGVLQVKRTNRTFVGIHQPLVSAQLFARVQDVKSGRYVRQLRTHRSIFSRMISCGSCGHSLIAEVHKEKIYYRCHKKHLKPVGLREDIIEDRILDLFEKLRLTGEEKKVVDLMVEMTVTKETAYAEQAIKTIASELSLIQQKIERLTDAYIDGILSKEEFEQKKTALTLECHRKEERLSELKQGKHHWIERCQKKVELIKTAYSLFKTGSYDEKREMVKEVMSNRTLNEKELDFTVRFPFSELEKYPSVRFGGPAAGRGRKFWRKLLNRIVLHIQKTEAQDDLLCA